MKYIKYLVAALLLGITLTSCGNNEPVGTVGQTTVQFDAELVEGSFGAGYVYVPITIFGTNADAMNTADVTLSVKVDNTYTSDDDVVYIAKEDLTGSPDENGNMGDIRITSYDMKFINNYEIADEDRNKPFQKSIAVEIMIINTAPEIMEFKLVLDQSNTTIGAVNECVVRLEKGPTDRLCGTYNVSGGWTSTVAWNGTYNCFEIYPFENWTYSPIYAYWDEATETMYMLPYEPLMWYDSASMMMCYTAFFDAEGYLTTQKQVVLDHDVDKGVIKFPEDLQFAAVVFTCDDAYNPVEYYGRFTAFYTGLVMTKK